MPAIGPLLGAMILKNVGGNMKAIVGINPMGQKNPAYFISMCMAIGNGIALGTKAIQFNTVDKGIAGAPPVVGKGLGLGIIIDDKHFSKTIYTKARANLIKSFKKTGHAPWPPKGGSGQFLKAMSDGIAMAVKDHYAKSWILNSTHATVFGGKGTIKPGMIRGIVAAAVQSQIISFAPTLVGPAFPLFAKAIAEAYEETMIRKASGKVIILGVCIPSQSQVCGLPMAGIGTGAAT